MPHTRERRRWRQPRCRLRSSSGGCRPALTDTLSPLVSHARRLRRRDRGRTGIDEPLDWICPLLAINADALNYGDTPEFAAISAVALGHNEISQTLSTTPRQFAPMHQRAANGDIDARPWCQAFYAAMRLRMSAWAPLLDANNVSLGLLLPIRNHPVCTLSQGYAHPAALSRRSGRSAARSATERRQDQELPAQRLRRYPSGGRGLAPILDADPLRTRTLITADVGAHFAYDRWPSFPHLGYCR
jgi:uncharacterized protein